MKTLSTQAIIIGAGPAGVAASVQLKRYGVDFMLLEKRAVGGLLRNAYRIDNYLGFPAGISSKKMVSLMASHLIQYNIEVNYDTVLVADYKDNKFFVQCKNQLIYSDYLLIASGTEANKDTHIEIDTKAENKIFYEVADIELSKFANIAIVGSGDAAFDYAVTLSEANLSATIYMRGNRCKAIDTLQKMVNLQSNIEQIYNANLLKVEFDEKLKLLFNIEGKQTECHYDALLFAIGRHPNTAFISETLLVQSDILQQAGRLHFIGDVKNNLFRQASISAGDGVCAAMKLFDLIKNKT